MNDLISIIVPVYKVEPYLRKCIDSILGQTYKNLEIILVDDGSPDSCGAICDEYAASDTRVRVIHKENGGLSSARNAGLNVASGKFIGFVDSDDWCALDMYEYLYNAMQESSADIVICGHYEVTGENLKHIGVKGEILLDRTEAMIMLLTDKEITNYVCNKLYPANLFANIRFPEGRVYEDIAVMYKLFEKADRILILPEARYYYVQRKSGIVKNHTMKNAMDFFEVQRERYETLRGIYPQTLALQQAGYMNGIYLVWVAAAKMPKSKLEEHRSQMDEMAVFAVEHLKAALDSEYNMGITMRLAFRFIQFNNRLSYICVWILDQIYMLKHGGKNG